MQKENLYNEFHQHSQDYLILLGQKSRRAERSKTDADELAVMEFFWDGTDEIFKKYEMRLHEMRLLIANDHAKAILLQNELRSTYNEIYKIRKASPEVNDLLTKLASKTVMPTQDQLKQDVQIRNNPANG
jgi:hypothetical protein